MNNELSSILENYFNLSYEEELYFSLDIFNVDYNLQLSIYIPQPGYYEKEYKKRKMDLPRDNFSIVTIGYKLIKGRSNDVTFIPKKLIEEHEFKIFPNEQVKQVSKQIRVTIAINECIELVNRHLPTANNAKNISYGDPVYEHNSSGYPYLYSQIRLI